MKVDSDSVLYVCWASVAIVLILCCYGQECRKMELAKKCVCGQLIAK